MPEIKKKSLLLTMLINASFWVVTILIAITLPPENVFIIILFLLLFSASVFLTGTIIFRNLRRGLFLAILVTSHLLLHYYQIANLFNTAIALAVLIVLDLYFSRLS